MDHPTAVPAGSPGPAEKAVETTTTLTASASPTTAVTKVIVAVHGIGEQHSFATIQSVVNQFCRYYRQPAAVPLGNFHTDGAAYSIPRPYPEEPFARFAFAEVYWATIPRTLVADKYTVEEAKNWARTIVERLRLRWVAAGSPPTSDESDFRLMDQVLGEMIQTIAVLDRICYVADRAGVFTFDLRKLLDDYLGDVQVVTEFAKQRGEILGAFRRVMEAIHASFPAAEVYVVAHSEGTVVSLLGLIEGFRDRAANAWTGQVRGLMTLGSPIDKHLALWPDLFDKPAPAGELPAKVQWRNYYDFGDPVGFELDGARKWMERLGWNRVFEFDKADDYGFTRYPFPGKAHVDYWTDDEVFGHFITTVVRETPPAAGTPAADFTRPPRDRMTQRLLSYVVPYLGVAAMLVAAAYVLFKAVVGATHPGDASLERAGEIARYVAGMAALLLGVTVVARIPRLTRSALWRAIAVAVGAACAGVYLWSVRGSDPTLLGNVLIPSGAVTVALAALVIGVVYVASVARPSWGLKPLILLGTAVVAGKVGYHLATADAAGDLGPIWPVVLATVAFLYLWWLAALVFDLVFVWHLYIRHSKMRERIHAIAVREPGAGKATPAPAPGATKVAAGAPAAG